MPRLGRRLAPLLLLAACGGGGGGAPLAPAVIDLGLAASTEPTTYPRTFFNPFGAAAQVTLVATTGPFGVAPGALPAAVGAAGALDVALVFTPEGVGSFQGSLTLQFASGGSLRQAQERYAVSAEGVSLSADPAALDFGSLAAGSAATRTTSLTNASQKSPVTFTTLEAPSGELTLQSPTLPFTLEPGTSRDAVFRVQSAAGGPLLGTARLGPSDPGGPLDVGISANLGAQEQVIDLGQPAFGTGGSTATLQFAMPADGVAFMIEAVTVGNDFLGLGSLTGPGGKVYENAAGTGEYVWNPNQQVFTAQVPNTDRSGVQLVAGGGTYSFSLRRLSGSSTTVAVRVLVERRPGGSNPSGVLDVNVWLAQILDVSATTAPTHARLQTVLAGISTVLAGQGVTLGDVAYYDVDDPTYDFVTEVEFGELLELTSAASEPRLNLFFVGTALGGGVVGVAGMIGGPKQNGTTASGVMSVFEGFSTSLISLVAAHEVAHFLGLWHTTESNGAHDFMDDTLECPASGAGSPCAVEGGGYLMHWKAIGGTTLTDGQGTVIRGHPLLEPVPAGSMKPRVTLSPERPDPLEIRALEPGWCATCRDCQARRKP